MSGKPCKTLWFSVPGWEYEELRPRTVGRGSKKRIVVDVIEREVAPFSSTFHQQCLDHCAKNGIPRRKIEIHVT